MTNPYSQKMLSILEEFKIAPHAEIFDLIEEMSEQLDSKDSQDNWVSVAERLPNVLEPVLICYKGHPQSITYEIRDLDLDPLEFVPHYFTEGQFSISSLEVTDWQPMPEPPKDKS